MDTKFVIILTFLVVTVFACDKENDPIPHQSTSECQTSEPVAGWTTEKFKNEYTIQFPDTYEGQGIYTFEGNIFKKVRKDSMVQFWYSYCGPLFCEDFGVDMEEEVPTSITVEGDEGVQLFLDQREAFCSDEEVIGYFFYNASQFPTGRFYLKRDDGRYYETVQVDFWLSARVEVLQILGTITRQ